MATVTDYDGNSYDTVVIGTQTWTVQNFKCTHLNDGTSIPNTTDNTDWSNLTSPGRCWYDNDSDTYNSTYGILYNWYVVGTGKLAPSGWHVPTDAEWTTLTTYLGGLTVAGGKLKESGTTHWLAPNTEATNESGFTALPGGHRSSSGDFYYVGIFGYWWPASAFDATRSWYRKLNYNSAGVSRFYDNVRDGFSVRLVQDIPVSRHGFVNFQGPGVF